MRRLESVLVGLAFGLLVVGVALFPLTQPGFTRMLALRFSLAEEAGLEPQRMLQVAEDVRAFVTDTEASGLPATVDGRPGFDAAAVSHLLDVRRVLFGAQLVTGFVAAIITVWLAIRVSRRETRRVAEAMRAGAVACVALVVLAGLAGAVDFERLFTAFHGLFFSAGTWTFPADSLLIQTFPEAFWATAAAVWGALVLLGGALLWLAAWWVNGSAKAGDTGASGRAAQGRSTVEG